MRWSIRRRLGPLRPVVLDYDVGMRIQVRPVDRLGRRVFLDGYSDREHAVLLDALLRPGMVYFDVGANFGQFALMAATRVGRDGAVHAFEATSTMYEQLAANVELNGLAQVTANHAAVADQPGTLEMTLCEPGKEAFSSLGRPMRPQDQIIGRETVPAITLDDYCRERGISRIDLIKIDVEGAEVRVIEGASNLLSSGGVSSLVCEFNEVAAESQGSSGRELRNALESHGYRIFRFDPSRRTITPEPAVERYASTQNLLAVRDPDQFAALLTGSSAG